MNTLNIDLPVNPMPKDICAIGLAALLRKEQIIHTVESETSSEVEMHTHNRPALGLLDIKMVFPMGYQSCNLTPSLFEHMVADESGKALTLSDETDPKVLFDIDNAKLLWSPPETHDDEKIRNPLLEDSGHVVDYATFIIREECEVEKFHGQMLPYRFVQVVWAYEEGISLEEQIAPYADCKIYEPQDPEIEEYLTENNRLMDIYVQEVTGEIEDNVNSYLDSIGLDFDFHNLETDIPKDVLIAAATNFPSVRDQLPNNPFFLYRAPRTMSEDEMKVYAVCYNENAELYNPLCSIKSDSELLCKKTVAFVKDRFKARLAIYHPDDIPDDVEGVWDDETVRVHRSIIFIPINHFNLELISHLNDDINRRLDELETFFDEVNADNES
tara:strand:+ start:91509 stop:92663 length:1155 start_codon:yes stop_codon:yes gene_type:complete